MREPGFYWVVAFGDKKNPQVASWDGEVWDFCGAESSGYAEYDDPTETRVKIISERLIPPGAV